MIRSVLVLPADCRRLPLEALTCGASAILLRPGAGAERAAGRAWAQNFLAAARPHATRPRIFAQIASLRSGEADADLDAFAGDGLAGVFLENCESRADVQQLSVRLGAREAALDLSAGSIRIVALAAQTAASVFALGGYRGASARLLALAMDESPLPGGAQARIAARTLMALGAAAAGVGALDIAPRLPGSALSEALRAIQRDGFSGVLSTSPGEITAINLAFPGC